MPIPFAWTDIAILALILVLAHSIETHLGFGSTIIALSLGIFLFPIEILLPALVTIGSLQSVWLIIRWHSHIRWKVILVGILPMAAIGLAAGILLRGYASETLLVTLLGLFIIVTSTLELIALLRNNAAPHAPLNRWVAAPVIFVGGLFQGLFASGGPPIVYYAGREIDDPAQFRSTLSVLWLILNLALLISLWAAGQADVLSLELAALVLPGFIAGVVIGSFIRMKSKAFKAATWAMLMIIGIVLILRVFQQINATIL
ncbi:MAG: TSUP family transporter [Dehalococcoidia bacterium]|nr:TSUP family transporter [Dehalococcoidia bacterium]